MVKHASGRAALPAKRTLVLALLGCLAACDAEIEPRTQLMLVSDTDVRTSGTINFKIVGPTERMEMRTADFASPEQLPRTIALVYSEGDLGPFKVSASIQTLDDHTITREHTVFFERGKTLLVPLHLAAACAEVTCANGETCTETGECRESLLEDLEPYTGAPSRVMFSRDGGTLTMDSGVEGRDAGSDAGSDSGTDAGTPREEKMCPSGTVDVLSDVNNCSDCDMICPSAPAGRNSSAPQCADGKCGLFCDQGWLDCNMKASDGCEISTTGTNKDHCGACNNACTGPGMKCVAGQCK